MSTRKFDLSLKAIGTMFMLNKPLDTSNGIYHTQATAVVAAVRRLPCVDMVVCDGLIA